MSADVSTQIFLRRLNHEQTHRTVRIAVRENAPVLLEPKTVPEPGEFTGHIHGGNEDDFVVVLNPNQDRMSDYLNSEEWVARVLLGNDTYQFLTRIVETDFTGPSAAVRLAVPQTLYVEARRKYQRLRFAESSTVELVLDKTDGPQSAVGKLCNISAGGLAVLMTEEVVDRLGPGTGMTVKFTLPGCPDTYAIPVSVRAITPAGSPDSIILRMEFDRDASGEAAGAVVALERHLDSFLGRKRPPEQLS
jgi:hypothetical protein